MKKQLKRRVIILLTTFLFVIGISAFLNKASFGPNFSVVDAVTGATKRSHHNSSKTGMTTTWGYSEDDLVLQDETVYIEENIEVKNDSYVVLKKADLPKDTLVKNGVKSVVVADMPLERAQSVMAEGGILIKGYMPQANVPASITVQTGWEAIHYLGHCMVVKQQQGLP